jgi:DNA helicase MCM8
MYTLYILANSVANNKGKQQATSAEYSSTISSSCATVDFTLKELYAIEAIQAEKNLFRLLVG